MLQHAGDKARHTFTVKQVWQQLFDAGVPRSERRIKYYCQNGSLDAGYLPSPTGDQWYINPVSVPGLIGELKQFDEQKQRRHQHAVAGGNTPEESLNNNSDAAGSSRLQHAASGTGDELKKEDDGRVPQHAASPYVSQLEKRIEEKDDVIKPFEREARSAKDEQITRHNERERETQLTHPWSTELGPSTATGARSQNADVFENDPSMSRQGTRRYSNLDGLIPTDVDLRTPRRGVSFAA